MSVAVDQVVGIGDDEFVGIWSLDGDLRRGLNLDTCHGLGTEIAGALAGLLAPVVASHFGDVFVDDLLGFATLLDDRLEDVLASNPLWQMLRPRWLGRLRNPDIANFDVECHLLITGGM